MMRISVSMRAKGASVCTDLNTSIGLDNFDEATLELIRNLFPMICLRSAHAILTALIVHQGY